MGIYRFYVDDLPNAGTMQVDQQQSHHAINVLRCKVSDEIAVFDGRGGEALCKVVGTHRRLLQVELIRRTDTNRELPFPVILAVALPKGDRQKLLVDSLVQLGVSSLLPLETQRGVAQPTNPVIERLQRQVVESCRQCGRNVLMEIRQPVDVNTFATEFGSPNSRVLCLVAHPHDKMNEHAIPKLKWPELVGPCAGAIGPEGGFVESEIACLIQAGWNPYSFGKSILRIETAAIAMSANIANWMR